MNKDQSKDKFKTAHEHANRQAEELASMIGAQNLGDAAHEAAWERAKIFPRSHGLRGNADQSQHAFPRGSMGTRIKQRIAESCSFYKIYILPRVTEKLRTITLLQ